MLQTQKVRLTNYLDERSAYLTQFSEDAIAEFDEIGENALKDLDEAGARIMENLESRVRAFEECAKLRKGLFFKNLRERAPGEQAEAKEEIEKIKEINKETPG
ncbi:uncharacterized protein LOC122075479 [Macadamia integrifolia]|uniref:uncharacterized protein LOC122075479 n=1 Tax=Macadamia integrifolia TaxID=60698 RepID=UPI001C4FB59F|nr:uncharacterized protein LOC122075479 [Macadamia integrifolia]